MSSSLSRLSEATQSGLTLSSLGAQLPQQISYYPQQSVVPIGVQTQQQQQQQQVIYGGGMSSTGASSSANMLVSQPPQQSEMRPTDAQTTAQGTVYPKRIFVGGIPAQTTEADLKLYFSQYGSVTETKIIQDRAGVSKGYGFVTFESADEVNKILAKDQQETLIFKDRKLNLGPAIRKNQLTQPGQPTSAPAIMYLPNSVPINGEGGQTFMLVPPMPMGDGNYGSYQTALPMIAAASGGQAIYFQQPTYLMPQQQIATNAINAIQVPSFQPQQQPQQHQIHQAATPLNTSQQQQAYQYRAAPQTPPTPGGYPLTPVTCHYTPGGPTSTSDFYGADYEPIQSQAAAADDSTSTWGSLSWGSQVAYSAASDVPNPTGGLNLNRELDVAADPFTIPEAPSSTVHEIKQEPSTTAGVKGSGSGYVSSTSSNVSLYNSASGSGNQNGDSSQNDNFSGSFHKAGSVNGDSINHDRRPPVGEIPPPLSTDPFDEENKDPVSCDDGDGSDSRRRSSTSGSDKNASICKRTLDETETDEPSVPGTAPPDEAQPEIKPYLKTDPSPSPSQQQQQPSKKRKSTSSDDEVPSSSSGPLMMSPPPLLNLPSIPSIDGFFHYASPSPFFPLIPFMMPNQFPNLCAPDYGICATASSVNIEQPTNEIFESSKTENIHPL